MLQSVEWDKLDIDTVVENSYKDFHAKGIDYICLHRSLSLTLKVYFFRDGAQEASEVVNPHDHRYSFTTKCLAGAVRNKWYRRSIPWDKFPVEMYNHYEWRTPLLGGNGFTHTGEIGLSLRKTCTAEAGDSYYMRAEEFHTIQIAAHDTAIVVAQYVDELPVDIPTSTYTKSPQPPDLTGLYNKFTADEVVKKIQEIQQLAGSSS